MSISVFLGRIFNVSASLALKYEPAEAEIQALTETDGRQTLHHHHH